MRDIKFISLSDKITVSDIKDDGGITFLLYVSPTSLYVDQIEIIDPIAGIAILHSSDFSILDYQTIKITKPTKMLNTNFNGSTFNFLTSVLTSKDKVKLVLTPTQRVKSYSGTQKLIQQIIKILLSEAGSNRFLIEEGGNLLGGLNLVAGSGNIDLVIASVSDSIDMVEDYIIKKQIGQNVSADEKLLSLQATDFKTTLDGSLEVIISLRTFAGDAITIPLAL